MPRARRRLRSRWRREPGRGRRARVVIPDVEFGAFPINNGGRAEYVTVDVSFVASEARTIVT